MALQDHFWEVATTESSYLGKRTDGIVEAYRHNGKPVRMPHRPTIVVTSATRTSGASLAYARARMKDTSRF